MAASDSLPADRPLPGITGYRTPSSGSNSQATGPGRASPVPVITIRTFRALYAEEFFGAVIQDLHPFHGLRPEEPGSALPHSRQGGLSLRRGRLHLTLRTARSLPPKGLSTLGFDPTPFPGRAASLLPGLLAATRTGLTPAGDNELMLDHELHLDLQLWTHLLREIRLSGHDRR
jgi:hypothetical protein